MLEYCMQIRKPLKVTVKVASKTKKKAGLHLAVFFILFNMVKKSQQRRISTTYQ